MSYKITVSQNGQHLFTTTEHSIHTESEMKYIVNIFQTRFLESDNYKISVMNWETSGTQVDITTLA